MYRSISRLTAVALFASAANVGSAAAQDDAAAPVTLDGRYIADIVHVLQGAKEAETYLLHDAEIAAAFDLDRLLGARGLTAGAHLLATAGGRPNDAAGTLQGIDNVEVGAHRVKLYEAWIEQAIAGDRASLRLGLTDLNADFYQNDSAGLLMAPAFGIGSELASTGPNGPSIFPSTALTARVSMKMGKSGYARAAIVNAKSGVIGDLHGIDFTMRDGALLIAEAGSTRGGKLALGVWRYTARQDDVYAIDVNGNPLQRVATGAYVLADQKIGGTAGRPRIDDGQRAGRADPRVFGPPPGAYGVGILQLLEQKTWRTDDDLAAELDGDAPSSGRLFVHATGDGWVYKVGFLDAYTGTMDRVELERRGTGPAYPTIVVTAGGKSDSTIVTVLPVADAYVRDGASSAPSSRGG